MVMEGMCLDSLYVHVVNEQADTLKNKEIRKKADSRISNWTWRCINHLKTLLPKSRLLLVKRLRTEIQCAAKFDFLQMIDAIKYQRGWPYVPWNPRLTSGHHGYSQESWFTKNVL